MNPDADPEVSVILPTYNEFGSILPCISAVRSALESFGFEVIVVDDDSPDGTADRVETVYAKAPDVRLIRRVGESGLASAVVRGMREAVGRYYVVMDADLQHPPEAVPELVFSLDAGHDLAIGSRYIEGGSVGAWPRSRRIVALGAASLAWLAVPGARRVHDPMSGFFAVRARNVNALLGDMDPEGYKILLEILGRCDLPSLIERPIEFNERHAGESNFGWREIGEYLTQLMRLRFKTQRHQRISPTITTDREPRP